jgi:hypothetical protein
MSDSTEIEQLRHDYELRIERYITITSDQADEIYRLREELRKAKYGGEDETVHE